MIYYFNHQLAAKYEVEKEQEARLWVEAIIGEPLDSVSVVAVWLDGGVVG